MPASATPHSISGAILAGLSAEQLEKARSSGTLIPYNWKSTGKDKETMENYNLVLLELLKINGSGVFNKLALQQAVAKVSEVLGKALKDINSDSLAIKQLMMDLIKRKKNSTSGARQPAWLMTLFKTMSGGHEAQEDEHDQQPEEDITQEVNNMKLAEGWKRVPGTRVLLKRASDISEAEVSIAKHMRT